MQLTPVTDSPKAAGKWLTGTSEGVITKQGAAPYLPGERKGMVKIKRVRTADCVVAAFRFGKEEGARWGSLILGMYDDGKQLHIVGHTSGFTAKQKRELIELLEPYRTSQRGSGEPSRWKSEEELVWGGSPPRAGVRGGLRPHRRATGFATGPSSCAGATTRRRANATSRSCGPDRGSGPAGPAAKRRPRSPASPT